MNQPTLFPMPPDPVSSGNYLRPHWVGERAAPVDVVEPDSAEAYWFQNVVTFPIFDPDKEHLAVLFLNTKMKCFGWNLVSIGSLNQTIAHPREMLRPVIAAAAFAFLLMHNHPSGDTGPSDADQRMTRRLGEVCKLLEITLADHVIVGRSFADRRFSFREGCLL